AHVTLLLEAMTAPTLARVAGDAFTTITGIEIEPALQAPPPADADPTALGDEPLPWPDRTAVERTWQARAAELPAGARRILGRPMSPDALADVLREGAQHRRAGAALEMSLRTPGSVLTEVRARCSATAAR